MHENDDSSNIASKLLGEGTSRREFMDTTAKLGGSALALSALGGGTVAASGTQTEGAAVTLQNQESDGSTVMVASAAVPEGGFVAIHDLSLLEGEVLGSVIGVSELLDAGEHQNIEVTLFEGVPGAQFDQSALQETQPLIAMPHQNTNGNESYDFVSSQGEADGPYTRAGAPVVGLGYAIVQSETTMGGETTTTE
ncbi:hypothetical protein M0R88_09615 [Halorussus gelatinilyticus]|uniref:DUF7282 domain-containing protein n=1 Tax=Halorussus gelatinilyticus TaxID=2937524 RepID=A0A8U0ICM0_9EURY|nr:hypothetical protein [Halorussus gelatinilyticus]UPV98789.1 hypothetical protein M0R88_09615 [Halorussus gelatinilyticus]